MAQKNIQGDLNVVGTIKKDNVPLPTASDVHYTNINPTTMDVGGIAKGTTFDNTPINDILTTLLYPYVPLGPLSVTAQQPFGTYEYGTAVTVSKVTPTFTLGSQQINSFTVGTQPHLIDLYASSSAVSGTEVTLSTALHLDGTEDKTIYFQLYDGTTFRETTGTVSFQYYAYSNVSQSTAPATSGCTRQSNTDADNTYAYGAGDYLWLYSRGGGKRIQTYVLGQWADVTTEYAGEVTLTLQSGATATYHAYRTVQFGASGSARYRLA